MPLRVKARSSGDDTGLLPSPFLSNRQKTAILPDIQFEDSFRVVIKKLSIYIADAVVLPCTFEQLRTTSAGDHLRALVLHLSNTCDNPCIVNALLALKWHYGAAASDRSLSEARASACEIVAWRFLTHLSEREVVDFCLYEIPGSKRAPGGVSAPLASAAEDLRGGRDEESGGRIAENPALAHDESSPLLARFWPSHRGQNGFSSGDHATHRRHPSASGSKRYQLLRSLSRLTMGMTTYDRHAGQEDAGHTEADNDNHTDEDIDDNDDIDEEDEDYDDPTAPFVQLNALEIAAIADAKRFLSQNVVQKIITGIWHGDIVFWGRLEADAVKKPHFYKPQTSDPFSRLRVPRYLKSYEILYFIVFLGIFYLTLLDRDTTRVPTVEKIFYVFLAAFAYDELSEWIDAGSMFYVHDIWNVFDLIMICLGVTFAILRFIGMSRGDLSLMDFSFDILALEALFLVPRISSVLSLSPYWGTLVPCFKEMTKDFVKFMVLVVIIYLGFLTTFSLIGRDEFALPHMTMVVTRIFFGASFVGFDIMHRIDPIFGPPLMLIFITLSNFLLMGSLTGMLSNSFSRVMGHAREEYLYVYSVYVLEASTSKRLTHFYPPFNIIALVIFRPLRLFLPSDSKFRAARISLLKATHFPIVAVIQLYELLSGKLRDAGARYSSSALHGPRHQTPVPSLVGASSTRQNAAGGTTAARFGYNDTTVTFGEGVSARHRRLTARVASAGYQPLDSVVRNEACHPLSMSDLLPRPPSTHVRSDLGASTSSLAPTTAEDTEMEGPSDSEARIAELTAKVERLEQALSAKIDRLAEIVLQVQASPAT